METVEIKTSEGTIVVELFREKAPSTVDNFLSYVDSGVYEGTVFHRVIPGFMIQGGGFAPDGKQTETLEPIRLENPEGNLRGTVAMARTSDPDSATSQFFINLADNSFLDRNPKSDGYAVFGKVVSGMDVVDRIAEAETGRRGMHDDWPSEDIVIEMVSRKG